MPTATFGITAEVSLRVPELPEVETIVRGLRRAVVGRTVNAASVLLARVLDGVSPQTMQRELAGRRIDAVERRAKWIVIGLDSGRSLLVHLRMTGRAIVQPAGAKALEPYTNVAIEFRDGGRLCFADVRTLGKLRLVGPGPGWDAAIGLEPLSAAFTPEWLAGALAGRRTAIKSFLLDQRWIAGIGNIYACEALWAARIRPTRRAGALTGPERRRLHDAIRAVLAEAIEMRGTSVDDYVDSEGMRGGFQNRLAVYGRAGEPCERCGAELVRSVLAGRGTWWCRVCQRR